MKRILLIATIILSTLFSYAQEYNVDMNCTLSRSYNRWKSGSNINITKIKHETINLNYNGLYAPYNIREQYYFYEKGSNVPIEVNTRLTENMVCNCNYVTVDDIWNYYIVCNVLPMIQKKGFQNQLRDELEEDALYFIQRLQADGRAFKDPYLENYIYGLIAKIAPTTLVDGRPGNVSIVILNDDEQNAFTFSNGIIVITTGLLANLHSEDELVAILAHEIAHFVLDHSVENVNAAISRQKRAAFWAALATGIAATGEIIAVSNNPYYTPGAATIATAAISTAMANSYIQQQGMEYNHAQEDEADKVAKELLKLLDYNENALATALERMKISNQEERSNTAYISSYTHPALVNRIQNLGTPNITIKNKDFEKMVSFAVSSAAMKKYSARRYRQALRLIEQNIANNVATTEDYIIRASCLLALYNNSTSNQKAEASIAQAKKLSPNDINIFKPEIITLLRLNKNNEAIDMLKNYQTAIDETLVSLKDIGNGNEWSYWNNYFLSEKNWTKNMLIKIGAIN